MKTILITGASSGIGKTTAELFQSRGWNVAATMRNPDSASGSVEDPSTLVTRLDVTDPDSIASAVEKTIARFGNIDLLLNNAGYGAYGPLEAFSMEQVENQFSTNVIGLLAVTKAVLPHMRTAKSGMIVNISSIGGLMTFPLGSLYHGSKFAVEGLSESLHFELEPVGIRVKIVEPGMINTDFGGRSFVFETGDDMPEYQPAIEGMQRVMQHYAANVSPPEKVAEVIWQAANDSSNTLRYRAGDDAHALLDARKEQDDETFIGSIKNNMGW
ncbi:MAG: SDR family oxidoreductase [Pseudomonadota bacterium]